MMLSMSIHQGIKPLSSQNLNANNGFLKTPCLFKLHHPSSFFCHNSTLAQRFHKLSVSADLAEPIVAETQVPVVPAQENEVNNQNVPRVCLGASILKARHFSSPSRTLLFSRTIHTRNGTSLLVANSDRLATETNDKTTETEPVTKTPEPSNGSVSASEPTQDTSDTNINTLPKRSKLTAREKLKAARVRSRDSEPKAVKKQELGSTVLEALRESDRVTGRKRSGLPEAPGNLLDDSKRGMPPKGLTFELPVGWDVFLIILSVVVISTIMFTTTYVVWKVGAIHFNEY